MLQGFLVSFVLSSALFACFFMGFPYSNDVSKEYILIFFLPILLIGTILGLIAKNIYENRFKKLFLIGIFFVYLTSLFYAGVMILNDDSALMQGTEKVTGILYLGSVGFLLYGIIVIPLLALGVFLIELWTHPKM